MAAKKSTIPALSTLTANAIKQVAEVVSILGRATDVYRAFAILLVQMRFHFTTEIDGTVVTDWNGKSQDYKSAVTAVYTDAGITDKKELARIQSTVRNHVSAVLRDVMTAQGVDFKTYGLDDASHAEKQKAASAGRVTRTAKNNPTAVTAALVDHYTDPKNGDVVALATLIHNQLIGLSKAPIALDKQAALSLIVRKIVALGTTFDGRLTGTVRSTRTSRTAKSTKVA